SIFEIQRQIVELRNAYISHPLPAEASAVVPMEWEWEPTVTIPDISSYYIQQMQIEGWSPQEHRHQSMTPAIPTYVQPTPLHLSAGSTVQAWEREIGSR